MGASPGKKALYKMVDNVVMKMDEIDNEDIGKIFDFYVGKKNAFMEAEHLRRIMKHIVKYLRSISYTMYERVRRKLVFTREYCNMEIIEKKMFYADYLAFKDELAKRFEKGLNWNDVKIKAMLNKMNKNGPVAREHFTSSGSKVIITELVNSDLIVMEEICKKGMMQKGLIPKLLL